jgi:hypothetical protein
MTTNKVKDAEIIILTLSADKKHLKKRKATNFYDTANVKNKNRKKAALMKALKSGAGRNSGTGRSRKRKA